MIKKNGFTLIELLVVVAIIGILAAVGTVAYQGYTTVAKKNVVKTNWKTTVKYLKSEFAKCSLDSLNKILGDPGVDCTTVLNLENNKWACAAITLSYTYKLSNPLNTGNQPWYGKTYSLMSECPVVRNNSKGVGAGDGEEDGQVTIVLCPRSPYCESHSDSNGKLKVMWWWDNKVMQDSALVTAAF